MIKPTKRETVLILAMLTIVLIAIVTRSHKFDYKKTLSIEYNKAYNEKYPIIDTIQPLYKNCNPIFVRSGYKIQGHDKIGVLTGGSKLWLTCSDYCKKCNRK